MHDRERDSALGLAARAQTRASRLALLCLAFAAAACRPATPEQSDALVDAPIDALTDAPVDAPTDALLDASETRGPCAPASNVHLCGERLLIAHRGGSSLRPEETLLAFEHAASLGANVLEMDVHSTSDGEVVCMHDDTVDRTTNGTGAIRSMTLAQLRALDAGYRFTRDRGATFPYRGMGVTVATLREVLAAHPGAWFSIEIKQAEPDIVDAVLAIVDGAGAAGRVVIVSFTDAIVQDIRRRRPDVVTGMGTAEILAFIQLNASTEARYTPPTSVLQIPANAVSAAVVARANRLGVRLHAWTVNDRATMRTLLDLGTHGIMTDDPALLAEVLAGR